MLKRFIAVFILFVLATAHAFAESPIDGQIDDPVFVEFSSQRKTDNKSNVSLHFNINRDRCKAYYGGSYYSPCRPRLGLRGKKVEGGVSVSPHIDGEWRWRDDYTLTFIPAEHWLSSQNYVVDIDLDALHVPKRVFFPKKHRRTTTLIKTKPLSVIISNMHYMQDPNDPERKMVTARLSTNYPVIAKTLKERITFTLEEGAKDTLSVMERDLPFEFQAQSNQITANLAVPIKTLPDKDLYLKLTIPPGVQPAFGGQLSSGIFKERARVPSLLNYLEFKSSSTVIVRQEDGTPEQILSLETNVKAKPFDLLSKTKFYLLPFAHPVTGRSKEDGAKEPYRWQAENEVTSAILEQSEKVSLSSVSKPDEDITQFGFKFKAPAGRYLYMSVEEGFNAFGGYTLEKPYDAILKAPAYPNDIEIMQEGSILTLSGAKKLSLHARGTDHLKIEVAQILPEAIQHFISQTRGDIRAPNFKNWNFDKENIAHIDTKDLKMAYLSPHDPQYTSFDFSPYLKNDRKGIFLLKIRGIKDKKTVGNTTQRFVLVTDMGLLIKHNADQSRDVFLTSFKDGGPIAQASISVLGKNGVEIFTGKTNKEGHISLPDFKGHTGARQPVVIVAKKGEDYAFIPYDREDRKLNLSRFDVGGIQIAAKGLNAFLFSDRGIYRPGETANIGMIVKNADWKSLPPILPLKAVITDPRGRIVKEELLNFSSPGLNDISLETGEIWPTGTYYVHLYIADDGRQGSSIGNTSLRVEEFQPDRLKIKTDFLENDEEIEAKQGWLKPGNLKSSVMLTNLYGTAASSRAIKAKVSLNPAHLYFKEHAEYHFFDPYPAKPQTIHYDLPEVKTDNKGQAFVLLGLEHQDEATYALNLETTGYEAGSGKGVTAYNTALVSPMAYVIGYHSDTNLGYLKKEKAYSLSFKALNHKLSPVAVSDLSLVLSRKTYVSTLVKRYNGSYVYESVPKEETFKTAKFSIPENGNVLTLPTDDLGEFIYRLKTKEGLIVAEIPFSVAGERQQKGNIDRETVLRLITNKQDYSAGEKIELNISAPYKGAGLITLESDHVLAHKWFKTDKTKTIQSIKIPEDLAGKAYVNVSFVRDINSREIYLSPLSHAVVPFTANTKSRSVSIELDLPESAKPGEQFEIKYKGNKKGKALIFAVDEGILQVAGYDTPDPVDYFLLNRALQVQTSQMLDLLMPEYALIKELSANGGGAALESAALGKHLNPFKRKILAPAVYWSGIVDLDKEEKTLSFSPPAHFNGQLRFMAVAVGQGNVGSADKEMTVRSDIVITPNAPIFLAPDDTAKASVTIANGVKGSGKDAELFFRLEPSAGLSVIEAPSDIIKIDEGEEQTFTFTIKANETLGPASLIVHSGIGDVQQKAEATLSIRPPVPMETTMKAGYTKDGKADVTLMRALYTEHADKNMSLSALPTAYIYGLLRYLDGFPYSCTEQITSRVFPQLSLRDIPEFSSFEEEMKEKAVKTISILRRRQTYDGGFSLWGYGNGADEFVSVYAMDFLTQAHGMDLPVPTDLVQRGLKYLRNWSNKNIRSTEDAQNKAYAIYVLTRNGIVTTNEILHWLKYFEEEKSDKWRTDLSALYIAASYEMMQQKKLAAQTMNDFEEGVFASQASYKNGSFIKYARYVSILSRHFPERFKKLDRDIVFKLADYLQSNRYNTLSASYTIQALSDYVSVQEDALKSSSISVKVGEETLSFSKEELSRISLPLGVSDFQITSDEDSFFYTVTETGYNRASDKKPVFEGLEIKRDYQTVDGKAITAPLNIGDVIEAVIKVRAYDSRTIEDVAIVDLLPGGLALEPVNENSISTLSPEHVERREDRIIIFADVRPYEQVFRYRLRAVSKGEFKVPPPYAEAMYDLSKKAKGRSSVIVVRDED